MDDFDFDDIDDSTNKKPTNKTNQKQPASKANKSNNKNDDFFDFQVTQKPKNTQSMKKNNFEYHNLDSYLDDNEKKQTTKKVSQKNKQNESTLPRISISKSPQNKDQKPVKSKMDLSLQELPEKRVMVQKEQKKVKKQSQDFDYAVYGTESKQSNPKRELKTNIIPQKQLKQEKKQVEVKASPKNISKTVQVVPNKNKSPQKAKLQQKKKQLQIEEEDDYDEEYEQQIAQQPQKKSQVNNKKAQENKSPKAVQKKQEKQRVQAPKKEPTKQALKKELIKQRPQKQPKPQTRSKAQQKQAPINRYKQMVQKAFPQELDEQKTKKLKPDALNRLNDKMRDMIKGFSAELTDLIDKNLMLLRKPQNEIKQQIQGQPIDPLQAQIKLLEQSKKNNQKMLQISQKQLQSTVKMSEKMQQSVGTNIQVTQQLQAFRKHIALMTREISNLKNQIQKQGKKVVKMQENNTTDQPGGKFKSSLQISQKLANTKLQFQKHKKKLQELNQKQISLQEKIHQTSSKKTQALEKASAQGISFCSKEQKRRYQQLKKKHDQLVLFESKFKSSIKSKQSIIQHQMTDLQVLIQDYEKKYQTLNDEAYASRQKIFAQIGKAKKNPKINSNTKQILTQLQTFMSDDNSNPSQQHFSSLNYLSQNIYKKQYHSKSNSKQLPSQKQLKKAAYKNYIQQVARINQQNKAKITSQRRNSQINPFRKALTPGETSQAKETREKMNKTKDNKGQADKQKQRVWKSSNTQSMIRNPLKKQTNKERYANPVEEDNPLNNKQIMKLIDKNKDKIVLKQQQKLLKTQQSTSPNKKPFTFRASLKQKQPHQNVNALAQIPDQMEHIQKAIENRRNEKINKEIIEQKEQAIPVKLKDKQEEGLQLNVQSKPPVNNTPFRNIKLKKDKDAQAETLLTSDSKFKLQPQKPIQKPSQKPLSIPQNIPAPQVQQQTSFKPKRFNLRQKKQTSDSAGYMPSSVNTQKSFTKQPQLPIEKPKQKEPEPQFKLQQNKFRISDPITKKQEEPFDPFKKFMANPTTDDKPILLANDHKHDNVGIKLTDDPPVINTKPRMNLFKKAPAQTQQPQKRQQILIKDAKKQQAPLMEQPKFVNPYAKQQAPKQQGIKVQRQGRVKKINPAANSIKGGAKNIFGDVQDATSNNILSLGEPQTKPQTYVPKSITQEKELNVNDLLGIKKKNVEIDKDLLIDLPNNNNKVGTKVKAGGKASDFFGDMDL